MQLGAHFMLTRTQAAPLLAARGDDNTLSDIIEALEEGDKPKRYDTDKAWDVLSCALAPSGSERDADDWPWTGVILGAEELQERDEDGGCEMTVAITPPELVREVADALDELDEEMWAEAYAAMPDELRNPGYGPQEQAYAAAYIPGLREFWRQAAETGCYVVFHVDG